MSLLIILKGTPVAILDEIAEINSGRAEALSNSIFFLFSKFDRTAHFCNVEVVVMYENVDSLCTKQLCPSCIVSNFIRSENIDALRFHNGYGLMYNLLQNLCHLHMYVHTY